MSRTEIELRQWTVKVVGAVIPRQLDATMQTTPETLTVEGYDDISAGWRRRASAGDVVVALVAGPMHEDEAAKLARDVSTQSNVIGGLPLWRPLWYSLQNGIPQDPLEMNPESGPHGRKGVRTDLVDFRVFESRPFSDGRTSFVVWLRVNSSPRAHVFAGSRHPFSVWAGGSRLGGGKGVAPLRHHPWGLEDLAYDLANVGSVASSGSVAMVVDLTSEQAQRATLFATSYAEIPNPSPNAVRWWSSTSPALPYASPVALDLSDKGSVVALHPPVIASEATLRTAGTLESARFDSGNTRKCTFTQISNTVVIDLPEDHHGPLELRFAEAARELAGREILQPVTYRCVRVRVPALSPWTQWGLDEFSGIVRYQTQLTCSARIPDASLRLLLDAGTARVMVDGRFVGIQLRNERALQLGALEPGARTLEIDVANTLANAMSVRPSAYAARQRPSGGLLEAHLLT